MRRQTQDKTVQVVNSGTKTQAWTSGWLLGLHEIDSLGKEPYGIEGGHFSIVGAAPVA